MPVLTRSHHFQPFSWFRRAEPSLMTTTRQSVYSARANSVPCALNLAIRLLPRARCASRFITLEPKDCKANLLVPEWQLATTAGALGSPYSLPSSWRLQLSLLGRRVGYPTAGGMPQGHFRNCRGDSGG